MAGHPRFKELLKELADLHDRKNANYATDADPLSNLRMCAQFGVKPSIGALTRMADKWSRLVELAGKGKPDLVGESIRDTLRDLAVYCLLVIILLEEEQKNAAQS